MVFKKLFWGNTKQKFQYHSIVCKTKSDTLGWHSTLPFPSHFPMMTFLPPSTIYQLSSNVLPLKRDLLLCPEHALDFSPLVKCHPWSRM